MQKIQKKFIYTRLSQHLGAGAFYFCGKNDTVIFMIINSENILVVQFFEVVEVENRQSRLPHSYQLFPIRFHETCQKERAGQGKSFNLYMLFFVLLVETRKASNF